MFKRYVINSYFSFINKLSQFWYGSLLAPESILLIENIAHKGKMKYFKFWVWILWNIQRFLESPVIFKFCPVWQETLSEDTKLCQCYDVLGTLTLWTLVRRWNKRAPVWDSSNTPMNKPALRWYVVLEEVIKIVNRWPGKPGNLERFCFAKRLAKKKIEIKCEYQTVFSLLWILFLLFKGKDQLWSCDCIVKETLWNRSEKVDHLASSICKVLESSKW